LVRGFTEQVRDILRANGCVRQRSGKGDHEVWHCPLSTRPVPVDNRIMSRHLANAVLKQAGLKERI